MVSTRPKKTGGQAGRSAARHFSVIVMDLLAQFKVFGEALQGLREHMDGRFDGVDREILLLKDASLTHTRELKGHARELKEHARELKELRTVGVEHSRELKEVNHQLREIRTSVDRVAEKIDQKVDRAEVESIVERALSRP